MAADEPKFARTGFTHPFGKLGDPINGLQLPTEIEAGLRRKAADLHMPFREYLREVLCIAEVGADEMKRLTESRIAAIAGKLQETLKT